MKLSPEDIAYLRQAAAKDGYNPDDALKVFSYESSNRPDIWGGKGGNYFGLFQAGANERKQFGIDTKHPSAQNQIDAFGKFLNARGYKPGMGLLDLYSTVNAGSPGHYKASDGNGTVESHVAKMSGQPTQALAYAAENHPAPSSITELINRLTPNAKTYTPMPTMPSGLVGLRQATADLQDEGQDENDDVFQQAMLDYHNKNHAKALGLLGGE